MSIGEE